MYGLSAIVQTTEDCNLRCRYCSVSAGELNKKDSMNAEILQNVIEKLVMRTPKRATKFIWHGGEPLLAGLGFYQQAVDIQEGLRNEGYKIDNSIQTNGILINDKWAEFFKKNNFRIGISLDGPKEVNDKNRIFPNGRGTYEAIKKGSRTLDKHGIKHDYLGVLSCFDKEIQKRLIALIDYEKKGFKLNVVNPIGRASTEPDFKLSGTEHSEFFIELFENWIQGKGKGYLMPIARKYLEPVLTNKPHECTYLEDCQQSMIGVAPNGDVYPCARFTNFKEFCYGNIVVNSLDEILSHPKRIALTKRSENLDRKCGVCDHSQICNGGCPVNAYQTGDLNNADYECSQHKKIFSHIKSRIKQEIRGGNKDA
ncbi:MAG: radical SAM protein [archaeon]